MQNDSLIRLRSSLHDLPNGTILIEPSQNSGNTALLEETWMESHGMGKGRVELFQVFPGITLSLNQFLADQVVIHPCFGLDTLGVTHCRAGKIECNFNNTTSFSLAESYFALLTNGCCKNLIVTFPSGYYEGISIFIDPKEVSANLPPVLRDIPGNPELWKQPFPLHGKSAVFTAGPDIETIFRPLYDLPPDLRMSYFRLKIQELFLYLCRLSPDINRPNIGTERQTILMQKIHQQLTAHPERRYTIEELSRQYLINTSTLKETFKAVYGMPIASYMKKYRIQKAMELLLQTDDSIAEIAAKVGYETQGKFTKAFKAFTEMTPTNYRKKYQTLDPSFFRLD